MYRFPTFVVAKQMLLGARALTDQQDWTVGKLEDAGEWAAEEVNLIEAAFLLPKAMQGDRDNYVGIEQAGLGADEFRETFGEPGAKGLDALVLQKQDGSDQDVAIDAEAAGHVECVAALLAAAAKIGFFAKHFARRESLPAKRAKLGGKPFERRKAEIADRQPGGVQKEPIAQPAASGKRHAKQRTS
jgi:hypothetical protein